MTIPTLETKRLLLRGFKESDLKPYAQMSADPEVMQYIATGKTLTTEEVWRSMAFIGHPQNHFYRTSTKFSLKIKL